VRLVARTLRRFDSDRCFLRASALTYSSALAIVPLFAVVLALLKGAGFEAALRPFLLERFPVVGSDVVDQLLGYISRANAQAVGGVGFAALLISVSTLLGNIEQTLNDVFGARRQRGRLRRIVDYLAMVVVGAAVLVISISLQTLLGSERLFESYVGDRLGGGLAQATLELLPWASAWAGMSFLYVWMPNTRVPPLSALYGGVVGGTLFQALQIGYIELQLGFAGYHAIYGALAQLPILLVWIYASWSAALLGAEVAVTHSTLLADAAAQPGAGWSPAHLALAALFEVAEAFRRGAPTPGAQELAVRLGSTTSALRQALEPLLRAGILVEPEEGHGFLPASALQAIPLERALAALGP
jgi:membrane protein